MRDIDEWRRREVERENDNRIYRQNAKEEEEEEEEVVEELEKMFLYP